MKSDFEKARDEAAEVHYMNDDGYGAFKSGADFGYAYKGELIKALRSDDEAAYWKSCHKTQGEAANGLIEKLEKRIVELEAALKDYCIERKVAHDVPGTGMNYAKHYEVFVQLLGDKQDE